MTTKDAMGIAIEQARKTMNENIGGPFGAAIFDEHGNLIAVNSNRVLQDHDPTAHAEITAIREACKKLGTHDLSGCIMVATGYPCPMCLGAMIWANIKTCYYGCTPKDAEAIGFRDEFIYEFIKGKCSDTNVLKFEESQRENCLQLFEEYHKKEKELY
ncbi:MAG: nucleoside deaminase [Lachnospiraceae bacterium]|nr:nucleoside deaminase [Lachnospiraceae bacterium]